MLAAVTGPRKDFCWRDPGLPVHAGGLSRRSDPRPSDSSCTPCPRPAQTPERNCASASAAIALHQSAHWRNLLADPRMLPFRVCRQVRPVRPPSNSLARWVQTCARCGSVPWQRLSQGEMLLGVERCATCRSPPGKLFRTSRVPTSRRRRLPKSLCRRAKPKPVAPLPATRSRQAASARVGSRQMAALSIAPGTEPRSRIGCPRRLRDAAATPGPACPPAWMAAHRTAALAPFGPGRTGTGAVHPQLYIVEAPGLLPVHLRRPLASACDRPSTPRPHRSTAWPRP